METTTCSTCSHWKTTEWGEKNWGICRLSHIRRKSGKLELTRTLAALGTHANFGCLFHEQAPETLKAKPFLLKKRITKPFLSKQ